MAQIASLGKPLIAVILAQWSFNFLRAAYVLKLTSEVSRSIGATATQNLIQMQFPELQHPLPA